MREGRIRCILAGIGAGCFVLLLTLEDLFSPEAEVPSPAERSAGAS